MILTPHPGEFKRLCKAVSIKLSDNSRESYGKAAVNMAQLLEVVVVVKGHSTIVTDGHSIYLNQTGNAALATAGSGDILSGIIASLSAQGMGMMESAVLGVYLHGLAGDLWVKDNTDRGLVARELLPYIPKAIKEHLEQTDKINAYD